MTLRTALAGCLALLSSVAASADPALPMKGAAPAAEAPRPASAAPAPAKAEAAPGIAREAATSEPLDGRALLSQFIAATGGSSAYANLKSVEMKGRISIPAQGLNGSLAFYQEFPDKVLAVTELGPISLKAGFDGKTGWASDPIQGPRLLAGEELAQLKSSSGGGIDFLSYARPEENFAKVENLGRTTFQSQDAWKLALEMKDGQSVTAYLDPATMLQLGLEMTATSLMGKTDVVMSFADWKDFGGMKVPTRITQSMMGMQVLTTIESLATNLATLPSFAPPADLVDATQ